MNKKNLTFLPVRTFRSLSLSLAELLLGYSIKEIIIKILIHQSLLLELFS